MIEQFTIWGTKTHSFFDVWSFEHFFSGMAIGATAMYFTNKKIKNTDKEMSKYVEIFFVLFLAYFWESIEHYMELGILGDTVKYWLQGVEHWSNRLISDPLLILLGYFTVRRYVYLTNYARILNFTWLFLHIFLFPHSMYIHEWLNTF